MRQHRNAQVRLNEDLDELALKGVYAEVLSHVQNSNAPAQLVVNFQQVLMRQFGGSTPAELMNILRPNNNGDDDAEMDPQDQSLE